jgi:transcriptional regulator with XRE-family HTH domain
MMAYYVARMANKMSKTEQRNHRALMNFSKEKGFKTRKELAGALGITEVTLSRYLNGRRGLSVKAAFKVSAGTGIPVADLLAAGK